MPWSGGGGTRKLYVIIYSSHFTFWQQWWRNSSVRISDLVTRAQPLQRWGPTLSWKNFSWLDGNCGTKKRDSGFVFEHPLNLFYSLTHPFKYDAAKYHPFWKTRQKMVLKYDNSNALTTFHSNQSVTASSLLCNCTQRWHQQNRYHFM